MGKSLKSIGEVGIVDETKNCGLGFVEKTDSGFWSITQLFFSGLSAASFLKSNMLHDLYMAK